jgi:hypothetical protein
MGIRKWNRLSPADRQVLTDSIPVWEAALADEIRRGGRAGAEAAQAGDIRISPMPERDQQAFDALYLQDAERNARGLADWGIDGLAAFRVARSSIGGRDQIKCGDSV